MSIRDATPLVLILSADATAAALLGGLVELLGYPVQFASIEESVDASLRRARPRIYMVDCETTDGDSSAALAHARMRGISVVLVGPPALLERMRELARQHDAEIVFMPPEAGPLGEALSRAAQKTG
jgi:DNA-binding NtrC family response regulator